MGVEGYSSIPKSRDSCQSHSMTKGQTAISMPAIYIPAGHTWTRKDIHQWGGTAGQAGKHTGVKLKGSVLPAEYLSLQLLKDYPREQGFRTRPKAQDSRKLCTLRVSCEKDQKLL